MNVVRTAAGNRTTGAERDTFVYLMASKGTGNQLAVIIATGQSGNQNYPFADIHQRISRHIRPIGDRLAADHAATGTAGSRTKMTRVDIGVGAEQCVLPKVQFGIITDPGSGSDCHLIIGAGTTAADYRGVDRVGMGPVKGIELGGKRQAIGSNVNGFADLGIHVPGSAGPGDGGIARDETAATRDALGLIDVLAVGRDDQISQQRRALTIIGAITQLRLGGGCRARLGNRCPNRQPTDRNPGGFGVLLGFATGIDFNPTGGQFEVSSCGSADGRAVNRLGN